MLLSAGSGMTMFLLVFYTPLLLQGSFHLSPKEAGYVMTPLLVFITVGSIANSRIVPRLRRAERLITFGQAGMAMGCVLLTQLSVHTPLVWMMMVFALCGISLGFQLPNLTLQMMEAVGRKHFGVAGGLSQFTRTVGSMVGIGLASAVVNSVYQGRIAATVAAARIDNPRLLELLATPQLLIRQQDELEMRALAQALSLDPISLLDAARQGLAQGTQAAFWLCAGVAALSTLVSLGLPRYSIRRDSGPGV
jgi:MFS family permease